MKIFSCLFLCLNLTALTLSACGFQPLYGKNTNAPYSASANDIGTEDHLSLTAIGNIPDQEGQFLRNRLIDRLHRNGSPINPTYKIAITPITESLTDLDITKTADSTRGQLRLTTEITLTDTRNDNVLFKRSIRAITSYNILSSEFSTRVSESAARKNALTDLATQIETQLVLYFKRQK